MSPRKAEEQNGANRTRLLSRGGLAHAVAMTAAGEYLRTGRGLSQRRSERVSTHQVRLRGPTPSGREIPARGLTLGRADPEPALLGGEPGQPLEAHDGLLRREPLRGERRQARGLNPALPIEAERRLPPRAGESEHGPAQSIQPVGL